MKSSVKSFVSGSGAKGTSKAAHTAKGKSAPVVHHAKDNNFGKVKKPAGKSFKSVVGC